MTKLACIDTYVVSLLIVAGSGFLSLSSFLLLVVSYTVILVTVRNRSSPSMVKTRSTLTAHITVVTLFFGPCIFIYVWPFSSYSVGSCCILHHLHIYFKPCNLHAKKQRSEGSYVKTEESVSEAWSGFCSHKKCSFPRNKVNL